jgi:WD40 repeat protein
MVGSVLLALLFVVLQPWCSGPKKVEPDAEPEKAVAEPEPVKPDEPAPKLIARRDAPPPKPQPLPTWNLADLDRLAALKIAAYPQSDVVALVDGGPLKRTVEQAANGLDSPAGLLCFSANSQLLAVGFEDEFWLANLKKRKEAGFGNSPTRRPAGALAIAPNLTSVALGCGSTVQLWDIAADRIWCRLEHPDPVHAIAFAADGKHIFTGWGTTTIPSEGEATIWSIDSDKPVGKIETQTAVLALAFSPDQTMLALGGWNGIVTIWDVQTQETRLKCSMEGSVACLAFSPDGDTIAVGDTRGRLRRFSIRNGKELPSQFGHRRPVRSVAFGTDGKSMLSADDEGRIILWDMPTGDQLRDWRFAGLVAVAPDGVHIASRSAFGSIGIVRLNSK